jgi:hypothetical protein
MIFTVVKPDVIVDVKDLQNKMEKLTILTADNNFHTLSTTLEELQQQINAEKGEDEEPLFVYSLLPKHREVCVAPSFSAPLNSGSRIA